MTLLFYPDPLDNYKRYSRVLRILENYKWVNFHNNPEQPYDLHIFWSYTRCRIEPPELTLKDETVLNRGCFDISKKKVGRIFNDISINPLTHNGICVEKREWQGGHHFHHLIDCPHKPREGYIYQRLIDNREGKYFVYYRIFIMGGTITHVIKRYEKDQFLTTIEKFDNIPPDEFFTQKERQDILEKCYLFGLDFGELDMLIDQGEKIIIDVNNIVGGRHPKILAQSSVYKEIDQTFLNLLRNYENSIKG